jgi:small subunit ribosomal protein S11
VAKTKKSTDSTKKKKIKNKVEKGVINIKSTFNNTIISASDLNGNVIALSSPGQIGYKGARKSTAYAATKASEDLYDKINRMGMTEVDIILKGIGPGRQAAVKGLKVAGLRINKLIDKTPVPHNGCRPKKKPRN